MALHISIAAEPVFHVGSLAITNSMFTSFIISAFLAYIAFKFNSSQKSVNKPTGLQNILEVLVESFENLANSITGNAQKTSTIIAIPFAAFCWILLNNWFGLLPGVGTIGYIEEPETEAHAESVVTSAYASEPVAVEESADNAIAQSEAVDTTEEAPAAGSEVVEEQHEPKFIPYFRPGTADLNTTLALALISVGATQYFGWKFLGREYLKKFFNLNGIFAFVGILELVSELSKILSFAFRLFGNIFAGEVLLTVIVSLIPVIVPVPFIGLELFVGVIQALVFAMLTIVFMNMATLGHADEH